MTFQEKLDVIVRKNNSLLCVGLDPDLTKIPRHIREGTDPLFAFNKAIVDATYDIVCAYKPNAAFYEAHGPSGIEQLKKTCAYLKEHHPEVVVILDAKRADIGSTNENYARYVFDYLEVDAVTLHPYLGQEALRPFLDRSEKGCIILCRTSNPGAGEFQDLLIAGEPLYQRVARQVINKWNKNNNCLLVVGATYPKELAEVRAIAPNVTFLIPGVGAQGGDVEQTIKNGRNAKGEGMIVNSARSIIYASAEEDFAKKARVESERICGIINKYRLSRGESL